MKRMEMASGDLVDWSGIGPMIFAEILSHLGVGDFLRISAVCRSWRDYYAQSDRRHCRPEPEPPCLTTTLVSEPENRLFDGNFSIEGISVVPVPEIADHLCIGSSYGFLITLDEDTGDMHVVNPLTRARIPAPSIETHPDLFVNSESGPRRYYLLCRCNDRLSFSAADWYRRAILSPSLDAIVVIRSVLEGQAPQLAFARPGDKGWTALSSLPRSRYINELMRHNSFCDIIFHRDRLHAIDMGGNLSVFDLDRPSAGHTFLSPMSGPPLIKSVEEDRRILRRYLVEAPDGDGLFLLFREWNLDYKEPRTTRFRVFKLNRSQDFKWEEVKSIGEAAIYVGINQSMSLSTTARDSSGEVVSDCIYFTDHMWRYTGEEALRDTGRFDLRDGSIMTLGPASVSDPEEDWWSVPVWFTASLG